MCGPSCRRSLQLSFFCHGEARAAQIEATAGQQACRSLAALLIRVFERTAFDD